MKARVKATGEIKEVELNHIGGTPVYMDKDGVIYNGLYDLDFDVEEKSLPENEPDYWEKLKHQYAGMAMQGLLSNSAYLENFVKYSVEGDSLTIVVTANAVDYATALINRLKEEEK